MSIIYDALKKVESSQAREPGKKIDGGLKPKPKAYLLYILIACVCLFIANVFYGRLSRENPLIHPTPERKEPVYSGHKIPTPILQETQPLETKAQPQEQASPVFTLNGVFFSGSEGYALINNRVVRNGDVIDGATVVRISLDEVDLELGGNSIKLSNTTK